MLRQITYEVVGKKWGSFTSAETGELVKYRQMMVKFSFDPPNADRDEHVIGCNIEVMKCPRDQESIDLFGELMPGDVIEVSRNPKGFLTGIGLVKKGKDEKSNQQSFTAKVS